MKPIETAARRVRASLIALAGLAAALASAPGAEYCGHGRGGLEPVCGASRQHQRIDAVDGGMWAE